MSPSEKRVWTTGRKMIGNLLPLVLSAPILYPAAIAFGDGGFRQAPFYYWLGGFVATAWLLVGLLGLAGNGAVRSEMGRRLHMERPFDQQAKVFVGFARPSYKGLLDAHEEVGFLFIHEEEIEYWGETRKVRIRRDDIDEIRFRANPHSWIGLGRWICVEANVAEKPIRLLVEPRQRATMFGNVREGKRLLKELRAWKKQEPPAEAQGPA